MADGRSLHFKQVLVLGVDPGLARTGYAVVSRGSPHRVLAMGVISTPVKWPLENRLKELAGDISDVIRRYQPGALALEKVYIKGNRSAASAVERATGVVMLTSAEAGIPVREYIPSTIKKVVTGDGAATKDAVQRSLRRTLRLSENGLPHDAFDAVAVAICHLQHLHLEVVP